MLKESAVFTAIVPARYASTRLPGKPLLDIAGKPMVVRVAERARESGAERVVIATDDPRIEAASKAHGVDVVMTRADHLTGTDRLAEASSILGLSDDTIVVNVQGDEPLLDPAVIRGVADALHRESEASIATACHPLSDAAEFFCQGKPVKNQPRSHSAKHHSAGSTGHASRPSADRSRACA